MSDSATPEVGMSVLYYRRRGTNPLAAIITHVPPDGSGLVGGKNIVNLAIFNEDGSPMGSPPQAIRLVVPSPGEELPQGCSYCIPTPTMMSRREAVAEAARRGYSS